MEYRICTLSGDGVRYEVADIGELAASVTDATTIKLTDKQHKMPTAQKEHLVLPNRTQSPPTTL